MPNHSKTCVHLEKDRALPRFDRAAAVVLIGVTAIFLVQFGFKGCSFAPDTKSYVAFSSRVNFFYPWFLALFRAVFGDTHYFFFCALFQNLLTAWCIFSLCEYLRRQLSLPFAGFLGVAVTMSGCFLMQLVFTENGSVTSNIIISEGLAYPFYLLFVKYVLYAWEKPAVKGLVPAVLFSFALIAVRGQLSWTALVIFVLTIRALRHKKTSRIRSAVIGAAVAAAVYLLCSGLNTFSNVYQHGTRQNSTMGRSVILATAFYCSEAEDASLFPENSDEQACANDIIHFIDENKCAARYAPESVTEHFFYFTKEYDVLKDNLSTFVLKYTDVENATAFCLRMAGRIILCHPRNVLCHTSMNFLAGAVRSIAIFSTPFIVLSVLFYLISIAAVIFCRRKKILVREYRYMLAALILTCINCWFVSMGVFALSRYMFYNLPLLYTGAEIFFLRFLSFFFAKGKPGSSHRQQTI